MTNKILIFIIAIALFSCSSIAYQRLMLIEKNMSVEEVISILESNDYDNEDVEIINDPQTDMYDISDKVDGSNDAKILITKKYAPLQGGKWKPYYIFAFDNEQLLYWGMPLEFNRSPHKKLNQIGTEAMNIINEAYM